MILAAIMVVGLEHHPSDSNTNSYKLHGIHSAFVLPLLQTAHQIHVMQAFYRLTAAEKMHNFPEQQVSAGCTSKGTKQPLPQRTGLL